MRVAGRSCKRCIAIVGVIIAVSLVMATYGSLHVHRSFIGSPHEPRPPQAFPFNGAVYLAGPVSLGGARLAAAGFPNFRQINASNIKDVPPGSVVAVDWGGYLIKNINSSSVTNYLEPPLLRGP